MPRYERTKGSTHRFWEIEVDDVIVRTSHGIVAVNSSPALMEFQSAALATKHVERAIRAKLRDGYKLVKPRVAKDKPATRNPALEAAILLDPEDDAPYLVYADWLQMQGDPRGQLAVLQHRGKTDKRVAMQAGALLKKHGPHLLADFVMSHHIVLGWRVGFIASAQFLWRSGPFVRGDDPDEYLEMDWADRCKRELVAFLRLPSAAFLTSLSLGPIPGEHRTNLTALARAIEEVAPPSLRALDLGTADWEYSQGSITMPSSRAISGLHRLSLRAGSIELERLDLPELRELTIECGSRVARDRGDVSAGLGTKQIRQIATAALPKLERLELAFGHGATCTTKDLAPILAGKRLPALRHLVLVECPFSDELAGALASAKILAQLETLDLSGGTMTEVGAAAMAAKKRAFEHLTLLDLGDNALPLKASKPLVKGLAKKVDLGWRQTPARRRAF